MVRAVMAAVVRATSGRVWAAQNGEEGAKYAEGDQEEEDEEDHGSNGAD